MIRIQAEFLDGNGRRKVVEYKEPGQELELIDLWVDAGTLLNYDFYTAAAVLSDPYTPSGQRLLVLTNDIDDDSGLNVMHVTVNGSGQTFPVPYNGGSIVIPLTVDDVSIDFEHTGLSTGFVRMVLVQ